MSGTNGTSHSHSHPHGHGTHGHGVNGSGADSRATSEASTVSIEREWTRLDELKDRLEAILKSIEELNEDVLRLSDGQRRQFSATLNIDDELRHMNLAKLGFEKKYSAANDAENGPTPVGVLSRSELRLSAASETQPHPVYKPCDLVMELPAV